MKPRTMSGPVFALSLFISCALVQAECVAQALEPRLVWADPWIDVEGTVSGDGRYFSFVDSSINHPGGSGGYRIASGFTGLPVPWVSR